VGKGTTSFFQRHLNVGYNPAEKLIEQLEKESVVDPASNGGGREILSRRINKDEDWPTAFEVRQVSFAGMERFESFPINGTLQHAQAGEHRPHSHTVTL